MFHKNNPNVPQWDNQANNGQTPAQGPCIVYPAKRADGRGILVVRSPKAGHDVRNYPLQGHVVVPEGISPTRLLEVWNGPAVRPHRIYNNAAHAVDFIANELGYTNYEAGYDAGGGIRAWHGRHDNHLLAALNVEQNPGTEIRGTRWDGPSEEAQAIAALTDLVKEVEGLKAALAVHVSVAPNQAPSMSANQAPVTTTQP